MQTKNKKSRKRAAENGIKVCIVTKNVSLRSEMLRFVVSPTREIVFDVDERLPGRGIWVSSDKDILQTAVRKKAFNKPAGMIVEIPADLTDVVLMKLQEKCLSLLALARKAGILVFGFEGVKKALANEKVAVVFEAEDAAQNGQDKLYRPTDNFPIFTCLKREDLGQITGMEQQVHIAVLDSQLANNLIIAGKKLELYTHCLKKG